MLSDPASRLVIPSIALAEVCWIVAKGRIPDVSVNDVLAAVRGDPRLNIVPLTHEVVARAAELSSGLEMHDSLIVATVLLRIESGSAAALLTKDESITQSGLVPVCW